MLTIDEISKLEEEQREINLKLKETSDPKEKKELLIQLNNNLKKYMNVIKELKN